MKRLTILLAVMLNALWAMAQFSGSGNGTSTDPYLIYNPIQLLQVENALSKHFKLMADIDVTEIIAESNPSSGWKPIGSSSTPFSGTFDGNGHKITGLFINRSSTNYVGLFAKATGTIKSLSVEASYIKGNSYVGVICGDGALVSNCNIKLISDKGVNGGNYVGGIAGWCNIAENCVASGDVIGIKYVGGICGGLTKATNCKYYGNISGNSNVGGVCGYTYTISSGMIIQSCYVEGDIKGENGFIGGICGFADLGNAGKTITIEKSCFKGNIDVEGGNKVGGIIGANTTYLQFLDISECAVFGNITAKQSNAVAGIAGYGSGGNGYKTNIRACLYYGDIVGNTNVAGIFAQGPVGGVGFNNISSCLVISNTIQGDDWVSGISSAANSSVEKSVCIAENLKALSEPTKCRLGRITCSPYGCTDNKALASMVLYPNADVATIESDEKCTSTIKTLLKLKSTYEALGWDLNNIWSIEEGVSYPTLQCLSTIVPEDKPTSIAVTNITLSKSNIELKVGESATLTATVLPENATNKNVTWTSSNTEVATVENGVVTAVAEGNAVITVKAEDGSNKAATCNVTVVQESSDDPDTDISSLANTIYVNNLEVNRSETVELSIKLRNSTMDISAFSFNLILPEGFAVTKVSRGERVKVKDDDEEFIFSFNNSDKDGVRYVQCYTMQDAVLSGKDGEVAKITISLPSDVKAGNYPIIINHSEVAYSSTNEIHETVKSTLTIKDYIVGDANGDGIISITDVSTIASYLLGGSPAGFNANAADANKDGTVSITDVSTLASLLLGK